MELEPSVLVFDWIPEDHHTNSQTIKDTQTSPNLMKKRFRSRGRKVEDVNKLNHNILYIIF